MRSGKCPDQQIGTGFVHCVRRGTGQINGRFAGKKLKMLSQFAGSRSGQFIQQQAVLVVREKEGSALCQIIVWSVFHGDDFFAVKLSPPEMPSPGTNGAVVQRDQLTGTPHG